MYDGLLVRRSRPFALNTPNHQQDRPKFAKFTGARHGSCSTTDNTEDTDKDREGNELGVIALARLSK